MTATMQAVYVYGIVPAASAGAAPADTITYGSIAAVVGTISTERPLGAGDLREHDRVVSEYVARGITILPMRFGTAVVDREAIAHELLAPRADAFEQALTRLTGLVQFTVQVRYDRASLLRAIVRRDEDVARARAVANDARRGTQAARIRLGQLIISAINRQRPEDAERARSTLAPHADTVRCTLAEHPDHVADIACLVPADRSADFVSVAERLAEQEAATLRLKLLGPLAPYDFVPET